MICSRQIINKSTIFYKFRKTTSFKFSGNLYKVYKVDSEKNDGNTYGVILIDDEYINYLDDIQNELKNIITTKSFIPIIQNSNKDVHIKFTTHYNIPQYKAWKDNGLPTVIESMNLPRHVIIQGEISGIYVKDDVANVSLICKDLRNAS